MLSFQSSQQRWHQHLFEWATLQRYRILAEIIIGNFLLYTSWETFEILNVPEWIAIIRTESLSLLRAFISPPWSISSSNILSGPAILRKNCLILRNLNSKYRQTAKSNIRRKLITVQSCISYCRVAILFSVIYVCSIFDQSFDDLFISY